MGPIFTFGGGRVNKMLIIIFVPNSDTQCQVWNISTFWNFFPLVLYTSHTSLTLQDEYQALQLALTTAETSLSSVKRENDTLVVQLMALKVCFYSMSLGYIRERGGVYDALLGKGQIDTFF